MIKQLASRGYISLVISMLFASLLSCLLLLNHLSQLYTTYLQSSGHYLVAYAASLSGLRLAAYYQDDITTTLIESPTKKDFESLPFFTYQGISFKLIQTPFHIYAYATHDDAYCILRHTYP